MEMVENTERPRASALEANLGSVMSQRTPPANSSKRSRRQRTGPAHRLGQSSQAKDLIENSTTRKNLQAGLDFHYFFPVELRRIICESTITPFEPVDPGKLEPAFNAQGRDSSQRMLGYIVDPYAALEFRKQRNRFREEITHLRSLGEHITGYKSDRWLQSIERKWRMTWETSMSEMIDQDREKWREYLQKYPVVQTFIYPRDHSILDVYEHAKAYVDTHWAEYQWADILSGPRNEEGCRRRALNDIMKGLRAEKAYASVSENHGAIGGKLQLSEIREVMHCIRRIHELGRAERTDIDSNGAGLGWTPGLQRAISWEGAD